MNTHLRQPAAPTVKLALSGLFFVIYVLFSLSLLNSPRIRGAGIHENDLYFQADSEFFAKRVAKDRHTYDRVRYHPLFVLMSNPVGRSLNVVTRNPEVSASIVNALAGSVSVYLAFVLFYDALDIELFRATLYTFILGATSTHFIFSVVPDTFIFTSLGFIGLLIIALKHQSLTRWIAISVYTIGVTISNVGPVVLAAYYFLFRRDNRINRNLSLARRYFLGVLSVSAVLSVIQKLVYDVWLITDWQKIEKEDIDWYLFFPHSLAEAGERLTSLLQHVFLFSVVPPQLKTTVHFLNPDITMATFMETAGWDFPVASWGAVFLWITLLGLAVFYLFRQRLYRHRLVKFLLLGILFNMVLHFFYGDDFMLFACGWLIFLLLLVFFVLEQSPLVRRYARLYQVGLLIFAVSLGVASARLAYDMYHILLSQ